MRAGKNGNFRAPEPLLLTFVSIIALGELIFSFMFLSSDRAIGSVNMVTAILLLLALFVRGRSWRREATDLATYFTASVALGVVLMVFTIGYVFFVEW